MGTLQDLLDQAVADGAVPGAVAMVTRAAEVEWASAGWHDLEHSAPMARETIFRIASLTKPILAATTMSLVDDGRLALDDEVRRWLPEIADPVVVRTPESPLDDVVPANRPITVEDLLTFCAGWGFPADFALPAVAPLFEQLHSGPMSPEVPEPDEWMRRLAAVPLLHQPGQTWLYNVCSDILGVLLARLTGSSLFDVVAERLLGPLGMSDTAFSVPEDKRDRLPTAYRPTSDGSGLGLADRPGGKWASDPRFLSGAGGLVSTVDDWTRFGRMLQGHGELEGTRVLSEDAVRRMTTNRLTEQQLRGTDLFLGGQGWGYGGSVDLDRREPWTVPGRYGWVGGTGTAAYVHPDGTVAVLMTQVELAGPGGPSIMRDFWAWVAAR